MQVDPTAPEDISLSKRGNMHNIMDAYLDSFYTMVKYIWLIPSKYDMIKSFRREKRNGEKTMKRWKGAALLCSAQL